MSDFWAFFYLFEFFHMIKYIYKLNKREVILLINADGSYQGYTFPGGYQQSRYNNPYNTMAGGYQNVNQMMQAQTMSQPIPQGIKGRPVSSFDEAKASIIDMDGSLFVFTDVANKMIYTKQIMLDGTADLKTYRLVEEKPVIQKTGQLEHVDGEYVSREEFDRVLKQINRRFDDLKEVEAYESNADV